MTLSIAYVSARAECHIEWFIDSLRREAESKPNDIEVIFVDFLYASRPHPKCKLPVNFRHVPCKPTIWQGPSRITKGHWWAKSAYLNTAICLAKSDWLACVDDRSVLMPGWLRCIREAQRDNYAVAGSYSKHVNMKVKNGVITHPGTCIGVDPRNPRGTDGEVVQSFGDKWFGCNNAFPIEAMLKIGGYPEDVCDSLGYEDTMMGHLLIRNGIVTKYDPRMKIVEDRTMPESDSLVKRTDFGKSPLDKSHGIEVQLNNSLTAKNSFDIRHQRSIVQAGQPFPPPTASRIDWWDNADIPTKFDALNL